MSSQLAVPIAPPVPIIFPKVGQTVGLSGHIGFGTLLLYSAFELSCYIHDKIVRFLVPFYARNHSQFRRSKYVEMADVIFKMAEIHPWIVKTFLSQLKVIEILDFAVKKSEVANLFQLDDMVMIFLKPSGMNFLSEEVKILLCQYNFSFRTVDCLLHNGP